MQPPKTLFLIFHLSLLLFWKYHSSRQRLGSHGTTAAPQAFPFVTATNGASARGFVSVCGCACVIVGSYNSSRSQEQSPEQGGCSAFFFLLFFVLAVLSAAAAVCLYHTVSFWPCGSHGRTVAVLRGIRFVTATNGASVCACGRSMWACHPQHHVNQAQIPTRTSSEFQKHPSTQYSSGTTATAAVQHM